MNTNCLRDLKPTAIVVIHYTDNLDRKQSIKTTYFYAKNMLIDLLEKEKCGSLRDIYYTIDGVTTKIDYYNIEV